MNTVETNENVAGNEATDKIVLNSQYGKVVDAEAESAKAKLLYASIDPNKLKRNVIKLVDSLKTSIREDKPLSEKDFYSLLDVYGTYLEVVASQNPQPQTDNVN